MCSLTLQKILLCPSWVTAPLETQNSAGSEVLTTFGVSKVCPWPDGSYRSESYQHQEDQWESRGLIPTRVKAVSFFEKRSPQRRRTGLGKELHCKAKPQGLAFECPFVLTFGQLIHGGAVDEAQKAEENPRKFRPLTAVPLDRLTGSSPKDKVFGLGDHLPPF